MFAARYPYRYPGSQPVCVTRLNSAFPPSLAAPVSSSSCLPKLCFHFFFDSCLLNKSPLCRPQIPVGDDSYVKEVSLCEVSLRTGAESARIAAVLGSPFVSAHDCSLSM